MAVIQNKKEVVKTSHTNVQINTNYADLLKQAMSSSQLSI